MNYYPAYIHQDSDGSASGFFPGVPGCIFAGDTLDECMEDAKGALDAHLELMADLGHPVPAATKIGNHTEDEDCTDGFWAMIDIDPSKYEGEIKRINITLPENLINKIDKAVLVESKKFASRSAFIAAATRELLQRA